MVRETCRLFSHFILILTRIPSLLTFSVTSSSCSSPILFLIKFIVLYNHGLLLELKCSIVVSRRDRRVFNNVSIRDEHGVIIFGSSILPFDLVLTKEVQNLQKFNTWFCKVYKSFICKFSFKILRIQISSECAWISNNILRRSNENCLCA